MFERWDARYGLPALWAGSLLILVLGSLWPEGSRLDQTLGATGWNVGHIPAYAMLTLLTLRVTAQHFFLTPGRLFWLALGLGQLGLLIEALQPYFGRTADVADAIRNLVGILLALGVFYLRRWWSGARAHAE